MEIKRPIIPKGLDADVAMSVVIPQVDTAANKEALYFFEFKGVSERTALGDNIGISVRNRQNTSSIVKFSLKRDSLYHCGTDVRDWRLWWKQYGKRTFSSTGG